MTDDQFREFLRRIAKKNEVSISGPAFSLMVALIMEGARLPVKAIGSTLAKQAGLDDNTGYDDAEVRFRRSVTLLAQAVDPEMFEEIISDVR
ncbi:MAG: hypothetical protein ABL307_14280 [Roseitalea porphyridii]|uniref:hypothetical protein n=1 Tax=Roseitalea porphyridii TaxID=1852022 RepID=UPI0032D8D77D